MAIAVLSVRQRGVTQFSAVFRMAGSTATQVGNNFTIVTLTGATGAAVVGDTLTGGTSAATFKVTQVITAGATTKLLVNTVTGVFTNEALTTTAGTGTLAGTLSTANIGILETAGTGNQIIYQDRVLSYKGSLYCAINNYVLKYDGSANWSIVYTLSPVLVSAESNCHSGLHVFYVNNHPILGVIWGGITNAGIYRATSTDGTSWSSAQITTDRLNSVGEGAGAGSGVMREVLWQNVLYFRAGFNTGSYAAHAQWDPSSDNYNRNSGANNIGLVACADIFVFKNMFLQLTTDLLNGHAALYQLASGIWTKVLDFTDTGGVQGGGNSPLTTAWAMFDPGDGFLYCIYHANTNPQLGWVIKKVQFSGGIFTDLGQVQAAVLAGTGVPTYPNTNGEPGRWYIVIDDVTVPGTPVTYLYYAPSATAGAAVTVLQWVSPVAAATVVGTGGDIANALAHARAGGGERIWGPGQPDIIITDIQPVSGGERIFYIGYGGGTKSVQFWFGQQAEEPLAQATLAGPATGGGTLVGNQVNSVPMDGVTVNQITWLAGPTGDNVPNLSRAQVQPVAF